MKMNLFAKNVSWNGKTFPSYFTKLTNKTTNAEHTFNVKFRQTCEGPDSKDCPCIIEVPKGKGNVTEKPIIDKDTDMPLVDANGEVKISRTIWVSEWNMVGPFVDHSLDDYE